MEVGQCSSPDVGTGASSSRESAAGEVSSLFMPECQDNVANINTSYVSYSHTDMHPCV